MRQPNLTDAQRSQKRAGGPPLTGWGRLLLFRLEFLQRLRAADAHFFLIGFETFQNPAAARLDAFAKPLNVAHAIGSNVLHFLGFDGRNEQAGGDEASRKKADQHFLLPIFVRPRLYRAGTIR
jgi:hypothetical protein